jgi:hypothetical protein
MNRRRWRKAILALLVIVPVVTPMITLGGARRRVLAALQNELGRRVTADSVHLSLIPWPAVVLENVTLADTPEFGGEQMISADSARATFRLLSLWSGRLEFSSIDLDYPSINLVRNRAGRWNFAEMLTRAASATPALRPTTAPAALNRPVRFPYLEFSDGRLNFKFGYRKQRLYLDNLQGSLQLANGEWRLRARFEPARTDERLSNAGEIELDGRWRSAREAFGELPFRVSLRLRDSYLAAATALVAGRDLGLDGILNATLEVVGSGRLIQMTGQFDASALRRWDLLPPQTSLSGALQATYLPALDRLVIERIGDRGMQHIGATGSVENVFTRPQVSALLRLKKLPSSDLLVLLRAVKAGLPAQLRAGGSISGDISAAWSAGSPVRANGRLTAEDIALSSSAFHLRMPAAVCRVRGATLSLAPTVALLTTGANLPASRSRGGPPGAAPVWPAKLTVSAQLAPDRFLLRVAGEPISATTARALSTLWGTQLPWPKYFDGSGAADIQIGDTWNAYRTARWTGGAKFSAATFAPPGTAPIRISALQVKWDGSGTARAVFTAQSAGTGVHGSVAIANGQPVQFSLSLDRLDADRLWSALQRRPAGFFGSLFQRAPTPYFNTLEVAGTVAVRQFTLNGEVGTLRAWLSGERGVWRARSVRWESDAGRIAGSGAVENGEAIFDGRIVSVNLPRLLPREPAAAILNSPASGDFHIQGAIAGGLDASSARANLRFASGELDLRGSAPLRYDSLDLWLLKSGPAVEITRGVWHGRLSPGSEPLTYRITGTLGRRAVALKLASASGSLRVTGSPAALTVMAIPTPATVAARSAETGPGK